MQCHPMQHLLTAQDDELDEQEKKPKPSQSVKNAPGAASSPSACEFSPVM